MTLFLDGPAHGKSLELERTPLLLRVCLRFESTDLIGGERVDDVDALDQLDDEALKNERLYVYRLKDKPGVAFIDGRDPKTGGRVGRRVSLASYRLNRVQPPDDVMRDRARWQAWALEQPRDFARE